MRGDLPVNDAFADEGNEAVAYLLEKGDGLGFGHGAVRLHVLLEVAVADLLHNVVVVAALHDLQHAHHVLGLEQLQDLYF